MKRAIALLLLAIAPAFAAEVNFYFFPTGVCTNPDSYFCQFITQGGTVVWIYPSADLQQMPNVNYSVTSQFTIARPDGTGYTATIIGATTIAPNTRSAPLWVGGWAPADTGYVTVTSVSVTADAGKYQVSKTVKNPVPVEKY